MTFFTCFIAYFRSCGWGGTVYGVLGIMVAQVEGGKDCNTMFFLTAIRVIME